MTDPNGKTVLVTGGSRGIGAAEAVRGDIGGERRHIVKADLAVADEVDRLWSGSLAIAPGLDRRGRGY